MTAPSPRARAIVCAPRRVGLLGGSFNPAHAGHLHISREALKRLHLDAVWWLVSPQNPLKPRAGMAPLTERLGHARRQASDPRIRVTDIEARFATVRTVETLAKLRARFPGTAFVWLMGADNLEQLACWHRWRAIVGATPIAVFARPTYSKVALTGLAACRYARFRRPERAARVLATASPPAWIYLRVRPHAASATALRRGRG